MTTRKALIFLLLAVLCPPVTGGKPAEQSDAEKIREKLMSVYSYNDPKAPMFPVVNKQFATKGEFSDKKFAAGEYAGVKTFGSKDFRTKSYRDSGKSWLSKLFPFKKLPENLQRSSRDASKTFGTGSFATKDFGPAKKTDPYAGRETFATKAASDEIAHGKMEGAGDPHVKELLLQEGLKKGIYIQGGFKKDLSIDDVRNLLNKAP